MGVLPANADAVLEQAGLAEWMRGVTPPMRLRFQGTLGRDAMAKGLSSSAKVVCHVGSAARVFRHARGQSKQTSLRRDWYFAAGEGK